MKLVDTLDLDLEISGLKHAATWPAGRVYAARVIIKIPWVVVKTTDMCGTRALFTSYCDPQRYFCLLVRPASFYLHQNLARVYIWVWDPWSRWRLSLTICFWCCRLWTCLKYLVSLYPTISTKESRTSSDPLDGWQPSSDPVIGVGFWKLISIP